MKAYYKWIKEGVATNKPWDKMASEVLLAKGNTFQNGATNYFRAGVDKYVRPLNTPEDLGETTAQTFLGVRLQCARCHNHPFEKWTQNQFYQQASFFSRLEVQSGKETEEKIIQNNSSGEVYHPRTGEKMIPTPLDGKPVSAHYKEDRLKALVDWLRSPSNSFFAQVVVNRLWKHYLGRGLVEPVDDFRVTNPPTNEPLLAFLAKELIEKKFDLKFVMREILNSIN